LSGQEKIERDYKEFEKTIARTVEEEITKIRKKAFEVKEEAQKIGAVLENSINQTEEKGPKKKS
jgi:hypothetical protein